MQNLFEKYSDDFYEFLLLDVLSKIYLAKKQSTTSKIGEFSNLILDKFAIHSASFFHLSNGIIELKKSNEKVKMKGYDLFTVNSTFRSIMESYSTFNNIFVEPKTSDEEEFRFLLWKLDGLYDKRRFIIKENDFPEAREILEKDEIILSETIEQLEQSNFYKILPITEINKVYKPLNSRTNWRFLINEDFKITTLKITELIKHTCRSRAFINNYRYTSTHTHTNYLAIEHFQQMRGIPVSEDYVKPIMKLAVHITCLIISDIIQIDKNAKEEFEKYHPEVKKYIIGISTAIKNQ